MPTVPPYVAPYIDPVAGMVIPSYPSILAKLISNYRAIYPQVVYLGTDTAKYQELSITALIAYDTNCGSQLSYNARSPATAVGSDLDSILKINNVQRKAATYSTAPQKVVGVPTTVITNGMVTDQQGYVWALPSPITIPSVGSVIVGATCTTLGAIQAPAGSINTMSGGVTAGWTSTVNVSDALPGLPTESDSQVRARQAISVALPSQTRLAGTIAAIAKTPGVTRYAKGTLSADQQSSSIENPTGAVDEFGNPPHSISMVVEGGTDLDVATAIFANRGIGPLTNPGTSGQGVSVLVTDPDSGNITSIGFARPTYVPIFVTMQLHGLAGYTDAVRVAVHDAIVLYLNSLQIGETVTYSSLSAIAQSVMPSLLLPQFSITTYTTGVAADPAAVVDIPLLYYQVARGIDANVIVTEA